MERLTFLTEEAKAYVEEKGHEFMEQGVPFEVRIINRPKEDPAIQPLIEDFGTPDTSLLVMPLTLEGDIVGNVIFQAEGNDRYKPEHARRVSMLKNPFAVAMSNALKHQEVLRLKELFADDNRYLQDELLSFGIETRPV